MVLSNLLNNNTGKKKLLDRGPKIAPVQEFTLEDIDTKETKIDSVGSEPVKTVKEKPKKAKQSTTTVRVEKLTRSKLNALVQMGKAESVDVLIDVLIDEYVNHQLLKDEKKTYDILLNILRKKEQI